MRRGRPGPDTPYRRVTRRRWDLDWAPDEAAIAYDRKTDGMYPLVTNDKTLPPAQVLAPVFLKNEGRIEAVFTLYFLALLVQALIERELRAAMKKRRIAELPLYPEERRCRRPTTAQVLRLFSHAQRHVLLRDGRIVQVFAPEITDLQGQVLDLLGVPARAFRPSP